MFIQAIYSFLTKKKSFNAFDERKTIFNRYIL